MSAAPVPPDGEPDTAGIEAAKQAVYESMPVVLKDLVSRSEAEAAIGVPHGAGVPDRWLADVAVRAYLAAGRAAASPDPPDDDERFAPPGDAARVTGGLVPPSADLRGEEAIRCDERERLSARVYENGWCPTCAHKADPDAMPPHEVAAILVDPAEVLSPEEVAEYERCQQSVIDARRRAPMVEGQMIVGAAASPDERLREALALIAQHARLDLTERGIAEAERYAVIAEDALAAADREAPDEAGRICCRGMGADGGCNICAAEATR